MENSNNIGENEINSILIELIQEALGFENTTPQIHHTRRRPRQNPFSNLHSSTQSTEDLNINDENYIYRNQIINMMNNYNQNIRLYQDNFRLYQENISYALQLLSSSRPTHNIFQEPGRNRSGNAMFNPTNNTSGITYSYANTLPSSRPSNNDTERFNAHTNLRRQYRNNINLGRTFNDLFTNVAVRPTEQQILTATRLFEYADDMTDINNRCPITLEDFQENETVCQIKHCRHTFKEQSLRNWFQNNVRCPVCRYDIRDYLEEGEPIRPTDVIYDLSNNTSPLRTSSPSRTSYPLRTSSPDISYNTTRLRNNSGLDAVMRNITRTISGALDNYLDNGFNTDILDSSSGANVFTFEFPIYYTTSDLSGDYNDR
jgi:hypothetical protein